MKYDFGGYATRSNVRCADGRTIMPNAFKHQDGNKVPLVWQHLRDDPDNVVGSALLEHRDNDGIYCYCSLNNTRKAKTVKELIAHGDITALSIYANHLKQHGSSVVHGGIREVSLVIAGANPGAFIDKISIEHDDGSLDELDEAIIHSGINLDAEEIEVEEISEEEIQNDEAEHADDDGKTVKAIFDSMSEEQKNVCYAMIAHALAEAEDDDDGEDAEHSDQGGDDDMKHNVFDKPDTPNNGVTLTHSDMQEIFKYANSRGTTLKTAIIAHMESKGLEHGIENLEILFPEAKAVDKMPNMITRDQEWVSELWGSLKKTPFSRVKSMTADLTKDEARAKGYIKGKKKIEETFALLKRVTTPQTIYKKQGMDRDDLIDITDIDVVAWLKAEMRMMLNEELCRAVLIGDGRPVGAEDKINETNIRPVISDADLYTIKYEVELPTGGDNTDNANAIIDASNLARIQYKGSGSPIAFMGSETIARMLLARDKIGHRLYANINDLATAMRVRKIVEVGLMDEAVRTTEDGDKKKVLAAIFNPSDYAVGADKGGAVTMFDDFDIDYNRYKYLIETRCSGALIRPYSAIVLEMDAPTTSGGGSTSGGSTSGGEQASG